MWETILITTIPTTIASIVSYFVGKRKSNVEVKKLEEENTTIKSQNSTLIFDTYKAELSDMNKRFTEYIEQANKRAEVNKEKIAKLEKSNQALVENNKAKDEKINKLEKRIDVLIEEACLAKGCSKRVYLENRGSK